MFWWTAAWAGTLPVLVQSEGPLVGVSAERGTDEGQPWLASSLELGHDHRGFGARLQLPAALVFAEGGARTGLGAPVISVHGTRPGPVAPMGGLRLVAPLGDGEVVQRAWGGGGWAGVRLGGEGSVMGLLQASAELAPHLRPVELEGVDLRTLAHAPWSWTPEPTSGTPEPTVEPMAWRRRPVDGSARIAVGWDDAGGLGAAVLSARAAEGGPLVEVGLLAATAPARALRATLDIGVPMVAPEGVGVRMAAGLELRPMANR